MKSHTDTGGEAIIFGLCAGIAAASILHASLFWSFVIGIVALVAYLAL